MNKGELFKLYMDFDEGAKYNWMVVIEKKVLYLENRDEEEIEAIIFEILEKNKFCPCCTYVKMTFEHSSNKESFDLLRSERGE